MTTLPQTTGTRFPRAGNRAPAIPGAIQSSHASSGSGANQLTASDVWRIFRANAWLIALLTALGATLGYGANQYLAANHAEYTASGRIIINPVRVADPTNPAGTAAPVDAQTLSIEQLTQSTLLKSETLWRDELQDANSKLLSTNWYKRFVSGGAFDSTKAIKDLDKNLDVRPVTGTKLIVVSMSASTGTDAQEVVTALVDRHLRNQRSDQAFTRVEELAQLTNFVNSIKDRVQTNRNLNSQSQASLGGTGRDTNSGRLSGLQLQISQLITRQVDRVDELERAARQHQVLDRQYQEGVVPAMINMQVQNTPEVIDLRNRLTSTELSLDSMDVRGGKSGIATLELESMIAAIKAKMAEAEERNRSTYFAALLEQGKQEVSSLQETVVTISKQIEELNRQLGDLSREQAEMLARADGIRQDEESVRRLEDRVVLLNASIKNEQGRLAAVQWANRPSEPKSMSFPRLPITMSLATMLGLGLAVGIAFLRELLDTSIRSPRDLAKVGNLNMLGMIPHESDDPQAEGAVLPLVISQSPHSIMAENFRQVRTRLQHAASLDTTRSLLITSPSAGDGKTTVACNIAAGLALNGRKILLVDANFRRPNLHSVFGITNEAGFGNVLAGQASTESVAKKTQVPNLDVLPTGPRPANPTELLESQLLVEFIDRSLEEYDHVIFDSGPILLVSETVALAPRVDGVITVVKAQANSRGVLLRMRDALRQI